MQLPDTNAGNNLAVTFARRKTENKSLKADSDNAKEKKRVPQAGITAKLKIQRKLDVEI